MSFSLMLACAPLAASQVSPYFHEQRSAPSSPRESYLRERTCLIRALALFLRPIGFCVWLPAGLHETVRALLTTSKRPYDKQHRPDAV